VPLDRELWEARLTLNLVTSDEMPKLAWDALESGLDGPAIRRLASLVRPTWFQVEELRAEATKEMKRSSLSIDEAACRLARRRAQEIVRSGDDPLRHTREFEQLWIRSGYSKQITSLGTLDDEVNVSRYMGRTEVEIRQWVLQKLKDSLSGPS
jgi:hypothetical protein